jgi:hypothetical protein
MIQTALTKRPVYVPMYKRDVIIRFDADKENSKKEG